jgi:hypothetical protein
MSFYRRLLISCILIFLSYAVVAGVYSFVIRVHHHFSMIPSLAIAGGRL